MKNVMTLGCCGCRQVYRNEPGAGRCGCSDKSKTFSDGKTGVHVRNASAGWRSAVLSIIVFAAMGPLVHGSSGSQWRLYIDPVSGLTTVRHPAPSDVGLPLGTVMRFILESQGDSGPVATRPPVIEWEGATEVSRVGTTSIAECALNTVGDFEVRVRVFQQDGTTWERTCLLKVLDVSPQQITASLGGVAVEPVILDERASNQQTMGYFFREESIAGFHELDRTRDVQSVRRMRSGQRMAKVLSVREPRSFVTSVDRTVSFTGLVDPPPLIALMEWRVDGKAISLGEALFHKFTEVGSHVISYGPPHAPVLTEVETYRAEILDYTHLVDIVPEGDWITFEAVTDPPGHEDKITWLASTKFGTGTPILGTGPAFTVRFDDTWGIREDGTTFQWLGVKADNAVFGQDQKPELRIDSFTPTSGGSGTILMVSGEGFGDDPCDICAISGNGFAVRGRDIFEGTFTGTVSPIPASAGPSELMMVRGSGEFVVLSSPPAGVLFTERAWVFQAELLGTNEALSTQVFTPTSSAAGTISSSVHPGVLTLTLNGSWAKGDKVRIDLDIITSSGQFDNSVPNMVMLADATGDQCAVLICNVITAYLLQANPPIVIQCTTNGSTISLSEPGGGPFDWGTITIKVTPACDCPKQSPDLATWNSNVACRSSNNCYNYATNMKTNTFAQPGRAAAAQYASLSCTDVTTAAIADGLTSVNDPDDCPVGQCPVALVVAPGKDYHWYRRNANGNWSHKPGGTDATTFDASGNKITNPETADRNYGYLNYTDFCGYFCVDWDEVTVANMLAQLSTGPQLGPDAVQVSLLRYFGQTNPGWTVMGLEIDTLRDFLQDLTPIPNPRWDDVTKDFGGFLLESGANVANFPEHIRVLDGVIEIAHDQCFSYRLDDLGLEDFLIGEAIGREFCNLLPDQPCPD